MTRTEKRKERERRRQDLIGRAIVGVCAIMGGIWFFCVIASAILRALGVQ